MNLLEVICKELRVDIGEKWLGNDGHEYRITRNGEIFIYDKRGFYSGSRGFDRWESIFNGELKPVWIPKDGDNYYIPMPYAVTDMMESLKYFKSTWDNDEDDKWLWKNNLVYETKAEAIEAANKMLAALKEAR